MGVAVGSARTALDEALAEGVHLAGRSESFCQRRSGWQHSSKNSEPCWPEQPVTKNERVYWRLSDLTYQERGTGRGN